jgi:hypothetical protein
MLKGTLLAESLRTGAEIRVPGLRLTRVKRQDVSAWVPGSQPPVRTFLDFEADDEVADELTQSLAETLLTEGGWYADFTIGNEPTRQSTSARTASGTCDASRPRPQRTVTALAATGSAAPGPATMAQPRRSARVTAHRRSGLRSAVGRVRNRMAGRS